MRSIVLAVSAASIALVAASGEAGAAPNPAAPATEFTQLANKAELVKTVQQNVKQISLQGQQLTEQVNLVAGQLKAYQNMVENTVSLPKRVWGDVSGNLLKLRDLTQQAQTLAATGSQLNGFLKSNLVNDPLYQSSPLNQADYASRYKQWTTASQHALQGVLSNNQLTMRQVQSEGALIQQIQKQGETAQGQVQAIQVGNELAASTARQIASLRALMASQNEQTSLFQARELAEQNATETEKQKEANFKLPDMGDYDLMKEVQDSLHRGQGQ